MSLTKLYENLKKAQESMEKEFYTKAKMEVNSALRACEQVAYSIVGAEQNSAQGEKACLFGEQNASNLFEEYSFSSGSSELTEQEKILFGVTKDIKICTKDETMGGVFTKDPLPSKLL